MEKFLSRFGSVLMFLAWSGSGILHLYTVYLAFSFKGFWSGFFTFCLPGISEIMYFFAYGNKYGYLNRFNIFCIIAVSLFGLGFLFIYLSTLCNGKNETNYIEE